MTAHLEPADIQCNVLSDMGGAFPKARYVFIEIPGRKNANPVNDRAYMDDEARAFVLAYRHKITNGLRWDSDLPYPGKRVPMPKVAINIAFSWEGLRRLGLPTRTLAAMPSEFIDGMAKRAMILGDPTENISEAENLCDVVVPKHWDTAWLTHCVHIMVAFSAQMDPETGQSVPELEAEWQYLKQLCAEYGLRIIPFNENPQVEYQDASALLVKNGSSFVPTPMEHLGFTDGLGNPVFEGQFDSNIDEIAKGNGKILPTGEWKPLATGEFLLGHPDESQELPGIAAPATLMRNGTFLIYRKLHENVHSFRSYVRATATTYAKLQNAGVTDPAKMLSVDDACEILMAKMAGRWSDGVPLSKAPTIAARDDFNKKYPRDTAANWAKWEAAAVDFRYQDDPVGIKCPISAHMRRVNTRDSLDPLHGSSSALNNRRRIMRRGRPYGTTTDDDTGDHGVIMLILCASIVRQFEFVQQQWLQYGLDSGVGNDDCPLLGARLEGYGDKKFVVPVDPESGEAPFICADLPRFVEIRGGEYFFLPSMTALRMIGMGTVDPT